jgi:uncharacterized protein (DUF697 family)/tellurite resistance protein
MAIQPQSLNELEHRAVVSICILAAFADGAQDEAERAQIEKTVKGFADVDLTSVYQDVLGGKQNLAAAAAQLQTPAAKALAYEMAVCVCNADGALSEPEGQFLSDLRQALQLDTAAADSHQQAAQELVAQPFGGPPPPVMAGPLDADLDRMILDAAILNGALELIPHSLANMAIIPLQMRLVYKIGKRYGYNLDAGHIKEFIGTIGIGLTSQVFDGFARQLVGGFTRRLGGRLLGGLAGEATGSAIGFATTYALGQVAKRYYASGRTLSGAQLKEAFSSMLDNARSLQGRYAGDIAQRSRQVNVADLLPLVRQT